MSGPGDHPTNIHRHLAAGNVCCDPAWEQAYNRFESAEEEVQKFIQRLRRMNFDRQPRSIRCAELFCGRGGGLVALERLGFRHLIGVDLSASLLEQYQGPAELHLADCRQLPLESHSMDAIIIQGGLHHVPTLPDDLEAVLSEALRVLRPSGRLYLVEPWLTPFLMTVHRIVAFPLLRRSVTKLDALASMIEHERDTYEQWLSQPTLILHCLHERFESEFQAIRWGKLMFVGRPASA